jgi:hypothetical protein
MMMKILPLNSSFRDIGRSFRQSLPPFLTPVAPRGHVTCYHSFCHLLPKDAMPLVAERPEISAEIP